MTDKPKRKEVQALVDELFRNLLKLQWPMAPDLDELVRGAELSGIEHFTPTGEEMIKAAARWRASGGER